MTEARHPPSPRRLRRLRAQGVAPAAELVLRWARTGTVVAWFWCTGPAFIDIARAFWVCTLSAGAGAGVDPAVTCLQGRSPEALSAILRCTAAACALLPALAAASRWAAPVPRRAPAEAAGLTALILTSGCVLAMVNGQPAPGWPTIGAAVVALAIIDAVADRFRIHRRARMTTRELQEEAREQAMSPEARRYVLEMTSLTSSRDSRPHHDQSHR